MRTDRTITAAEKAAAVAQLESLKAVAAEDLGKDGEGKLWHAVKGKLGPVWRDPGVQQILGQVLPEAMHGLL